MGRPRSFDEQAVVEAAKNCFWGLGFQATGLDDLEAACGVGRSSPYLLYGSKRDLLVNAIVELSGRDDGFAGLASRFTGRYRAAFSNTLTFAATSGVMRREDVARRAKLPTANAIGEWVVVRADPTTASGYCRAVSSEIRSWERPGAGA